MPTSIIRTLHRDLYEAWDRWRGSRRMPSYTDLDPAALKRQLPYLMLLRPEGAHFRYRLVGTQVAEDMGQDFTGRIYGRQVPSDAYALELVQQMCRVRDTAAALFSVTLYRTPKGQTHSAARLILPMGEGDDVGMILQARAARLPVQNIERHFWVGDATGVMVGTVEVGSAEDVGKLAEDWLRTSAQREAVDAHFDRLTAGADYHMDIQRGIIVLKLTGRVTVPHLVAMQTRARADHRFDAELGILLDARSADLSGLAPEQVRALAQSSPAAPAVPRAIVIAGEIQYGLAKLFKTFAEMDGRSATEIFRDIDEANAWLEGELSVRRLSAIADNAFATHPQA